MPDLAVPTDYMDIWVIPLTPSETPEEEYRLLLSDPECAQMERFKYKDMRRRYLIAHARMRLVLSGYTGLPADRIQIEQNRSGKPQLEVTDKSSHIQFNLAHSGDLAIFAVSKAAEIGVDVEKVRPHPGHMRIAEKYFSPEEFAILMEMNPSDTNRAFTQLWCGKEALIKARGSGMSLPLNSFSVCGLLGRGQPDDVMVILPEEDRGWAVHRLDLPSGYIGAVATRGKTREIRYLNG